MKHKSQAGYTLVEVMLASILFGIIAIYGLSFFTFANKNKASAKEVSFALQIAKDKLEDVKAQHYVDIPVTAVPETMIIQSPEGIDFTRSFNVSADNSSDEEYRILYVTVTWNRSLQPVALNTIVRPEQ